MLSEMNYIILYTSHLKNLFFYISFETNIKEKSIKILTDKILNIFKPGRFDFILFEPRGKKNETFESQDYLSSSSFYKVLTCSYAITYKNFHKLNSATQTPLSLIKN